MHSFAYRNGSLHCENVDLESLARKHGTPLYVYSRGTILDHYRRLDASLGALDHLVCFATKACSNLAVLSALAKEGAGFDIVSGGELFRVLQAGGDPGKCTFAGVGKTRAEIEYALRQGIYCFNAESEAEVAFIDRVAGDLGVKAPVALRVNPNVDAKTHKYISTGKSENKFGIDFSVIREAYARAAALPHIELRGLQMHIGSQLTSVQPFVEAVEKVAPLAAELKALHGIRFFSIGGGIGIVYRDSLRSGPKTWWNDQEEAERPLTVETYASRVVPHLQSLGLRILLEPGRYLVGNAGVLLTEVLYEKRGSAKTFKIIDAGMNDLIRPALYEGHHEIVPVREPAADAVPEKVDVVGPVCESGDFFAQDREIAPVQPGEILAVLSAGAYGFVMASNYNSRPLPAEILVDGDQAHVVRTRQSFGDLIAGERIPE
ncbi:MAG: diaminopimelate decarboxylase [Verrucomicrobiales bacterium]|nr:diaminopimelate decarboxylase [Akkermansiaceae bacterium]HRX54430.1 diaminopimelate decarboxylase [Verrucomicrobiales bacterium]